MAPVPLREELMVSLQELQLRVTESVLSAGSFAGFIARLVTWSCRTPGDVAAHGWFG